MANSVVVALDITGISNEEMRWRSGALKGIPYVNEVVYFEGSLKEIILNLKPKYLLRGTEFQEAHFPDLETLTKCGGELVFSSGTYFFSSDDQIIERSSRGIVQKQSIPSFFERNNFKSSDIIDIVSHFSTKKVLVIGDSIVDEIVMCHPLGMSQEEPSVVVTPIESKRFIGGAAIVASHAATMGAKTTLVSIRGKDGAGDWIENELSQIGVEEFFVTESHRRTTLKTRFRSGQHTLFRLTNVSTDLIAGVTRRKILDKMLEKIETLDAIIFSDFSYGLFDRELTSEIIEIAKKHKVFTAADSQTSSQIGDLSKFKGVDLITPTEKEARNELKDENSGLVQIAEDLRNYMNCKSIILKLGADGILLHGKETFGEILKTDKVEALNSSPVDVSGAGDSLLASATLSLIVDNNLYKAGLIGSIAAAIQVSRTGNVPISLDELRDEIIKL
jgi:rfaE bifunctional protein kinase chain/domain